MITHKLQYISQGDTAAQQEQHILQALDHGVDWIQLRWKNGAPASRLILAEKVKRACESYRATLIINDHILIAQAVDADGVHLGLEDDSIAKARRTLGDYKIIGGTANTLDDVLQRITEGCDYIGLGPYRATPTKEKLSPVLGLSGYRHIMQQLRAKETVVPPIYAIGGIAPADVEGLVQIGIYGVAVSKVIRDAPTSIADFKHILS